MNRIKISNNFWLDEYIPEELYLKWKHKPHRLMAMIDSRLVLADQLLRDEFGPVTINNWWTGGDRNWSGIRTIGSPYYSQTSQHSWGRASDKIFHDASAGKVRAYIKGMYEELGITCIEEGVSWVHSDVRWKIGSELLLVYPVKKKENQG